MTSPFEPGTRQWARKTLAKIAANAATLARGELLVDEKGNVYGGDGSTPFNALKRLLRVGEVVGFSDENIQPNTSDVYLDATVDLNGRLSEGTLTDGTKVINKIRASLLTIGSTVIDTTKALITDTDENLQPNSADRYLAATIDSTNRVSEGTLADGTKHLPKLRTEQISLGSLVMNSSAPPSFDTDVGDGTGISTGTVDVFGRQGENVLGEDGRIPAWVLANWASRMGVLGPIKILVVAGQSNSVERSSSLPPTAYSDPRILQYNPTNAFPAANAIGLANNASPEWIGNAFARQFVRDNPAARILVVSCGEGSTGFTTTSLASPPNGYFTSSAPSVQGTWDRTLTSDPINHYARMVTRALAAKALAGAGAEFLGIVWSQGESDRGRLTEAEYAAKLDDLIAQARVDLGASDLPFIVGSMTPELLADNAAGTAAIHLALQDTPRRVTRTSFVYGPSDLVDSASDRLHWAPQGQGIRGRRMSSEGLYRARLNVAVSPPEPPQNVRISRSGNVAVIAWDYAPSRVESTILETSIDTGSTWTAQTLTAPLAFEHTMTVASGTPLWARMKTTNANGTSSLTKETRA